MLNKRIEKSSVKQSSKNAKQSANYLKQIYRRSRLFRWRLKPTFQTDVGRFMPPSDLGVAPQKLVEICCIQSCL